MNIKQIYANYPVSDETHPKVYRFCPHCGTDMAQRKIGGRIRSACPQCGFVQFRNPTPGVVVVIENDGQVLLGRRTAGGYGSGKWGLPQGYIEFDEDFLSAAIREVKEETGLDVKIQSIINVVSNFLSPNLHTIAIVLHAVVKSGVLCASDDLETLEWHPIAGPLPELAFEADRFIIGRVQMTNLASGLPVDPDFAG